MKHYKIVKKTFVTIDEYGNVEEKSTYIPYMKVMWWWEHITLPSMYSSGFVTSSDAGFKSLEKCEEFVYIYHKYHNKIGTFTIETVKKIDLE